MDCALSSQGIFVCCTNKIVCSPVMHSKKYLVNAAARARAARHGADREPNDEKLSGPTIDNGPDVTDWDGTVNCRDSEFVSS